MDEGISKTSYTHPMEYCLIIRRNEVLTETTTWENRENITLSERSQTPQVTNCMIPFIGGGLVIKSCLALVTPWTFEPAWLLCPWDSPARILERVAISFSR